MSRIKNVIKNAKVGLFFMVITFALGMVSRKIFLDQLGPDFIGLTTTLLGIIGFLSLAEMGLSVAVSSTLYKPLAEKDYQQVCNTIDFLGKAYKGIGLSVIVLGLLVAIFLPYFFPDQGIDLKVVYYAYTIFIISVVIEYVFNYKQIILSADQKSYVITYCRDSLNIIKVLLQILVIKLGFGEYAWLIIGVMTSSVSILLINRYVNKNYQWLKSTGKTFRQLYDESYELVVKTKQLMIHKLAHFVFSSSDSLLIYKFTSLSTVTLIGNYQLIAGILPIFTSTLRSGLASSVGNFIHDKKRNIVELFESIWFFSWVLSIFFGFCFYNLINPFIFLWLGGSYQIDNMIVIMITANILLLMSRGVIDIFINAYGLFHDVKAPIIEVIINIIVSVLLGVKYGAVGVLSGTFFSLFIIIFLWKPYLLYTLKFNVSYKVYLFVLFKVCISIVIFVFVCFHVDIIFAKDWLEFFKSIFFVFLLSFLVVISYVFLNVKEFVFIYRKIFNR
ncbi:hypothetical protein [Photobacterium carnosum]|uniref:hypothetical protein n=1 Tax=Photobacterium carnosum TaxID=2023717 RepID=UPI001E5B6219|nr:hypothetical protein [Photobacterium carnosum]MCD9494946.1 hypothetical protein [Photobacterium carnosum]